jgi:hypothetical protein
MMDVTRVKGVSYRCISCGSSDTRVRDSRPVLFDKLPSVRRRRHCLSCKLRFNTFEIAESALHGAGLVNHGAITLALRELEQVVRRLSSLIGSG